ncbi:MAG: J domain-containing protein [Pyrinomonadaceae bacterium]
MSNEAATQEPEVLVISFSKVGKDRYIWLACTLTAWCKPKAEPEHFGYVEGFFEALHECERAKDLLDPSRQLKCLVGKRNVLRMNVPAGFAHAWHRRLSEDKRRAKPSNRTDSARVEFVYSRPFYSDSTAAPHAHLILKKTAKKIVIQCDYYRGPAYVWDRERPTYHLDRAKMEAQGYVYHGGEEFTLQPTARDFAASHNQWIQEHAQLLGVAWPCNRRELTKAFRAKVKEVHPDKGGTSAEFIEVRKAFDRLRAIAA